MSLCMHIRVEVGGWMDMHLILSASHIPTFKLPFISLASGDGRVASRTRPLGWTYSGNEPANRLSGLSPVFSFFCFEFLGD